MIVVNARFLTQQVTGVQRFSIELSIRLKRIFGSEISFVAPQNIIQEDIAEELSVIKVGTHIGHFWEQWDLPNYLNRVGKPLLINWGNTGPVMYNNKVTTLHDITFIRYPRTFSFKFRLLYKLLIPQVIRTSKHLFTVSEFSKKEIAGYYNLPLNKISVIYNGMDNTGITLQERKHGIPEILFVGRISREKGVICLLNALNKVFNRGYFCKLKLVGQCTGYMSTHIHKAYKQLNIEILGAVSFNELKELYSANTIGVIPSLHEQCSYVAIEMSMFGIPMIVSDVDALSEMFEDEVNALKIPLIFDEDFGLELDEEKLADAIMRLIDDEALRLKLSANAIKNYQERFTLTKMIDNTINVYEQLIEQDNA